jgi:hypothetical protein
VTWQLRQWLGKDAGYISLQVLIELANLCCLCTFFSTPQTGRTKSYYASQAIVEKIEDLDDISGRTNP